MNFCLRVALVVKFSVNIVNSNVTFTSAELKTSGNRKLSRAHSSWRLFCRGVPVSNRRLVVLNSRTISESYMGKKVIFALLAKLVKGVNRCKDPFDFRSCLTFDFSFLILWASSMTRYLQLNFLNTAFSMMSIS